QQQRAVDDQEHADPREARSAIVLAAPLPRVGTGAALLGGWLARRSGRGILDRLWLAVGGVHELLPQVRDTSARHKCAVMRVTLRSQACAGATPESLPSRPDAAARSSSSSTWLNPKRSASRPSGPGAHQFQRPRRRIVAGTRRTRTMVASRATARAMPTPMLLIVTVSARANAAKTVTMTIAAPVMTPAVFDRPSATAAALSPVRR